MTRPLHVIANEIRADFNDRGKPLPYAAKPYVEAMQTLTDISDNYYYDSADSVVRYALSNLSGWRGDKAREIKAELKAML